VSLESASQISQLNVTWPETTSTASKADDHLRVFKAAMQGSFPNISSEMSANSFELNQIVGINIQVQAQINALGTAVEDASVSLNTDIRAMSASLGASLRDMSANLDLKIENLSDSMNPAIEVLSATYATNIGNMSAGLDNIIRTLSGTLNTNKLDIDATAVDSLAWGGAHQFFQTATPTTMVEGDLWFQL